MFFFFLFFFLGGGGEVEGFPHDHGNQNCDRESEDRPRLQSHRVFPGQIMMRIAIV